MGYNLTDEERQRRSELARQLHQQVDPETGRRRFGGPQPGSGRPRKTRAAEMIADEATKEAKKIVEVFKDAIQPSQPVATRLQAAKEWLSIEHKEAALQLQEDRDLREMNQDELLDKVAGTMIRLAQGGYLDTAMAQALGMPVQNGEVVDLDEQDFEVMDESAA